MKKIIVLVCIGAMFTNANAEEKTQAQRMGESMGKSFYDGLKGTAIGIFGNAGKDIKEATKPEAINTIISNGKKKTYQGGKLISIEEVNR